MTRSCRPVRKNRPRILENLLEAQKIAFAPFIFEACASALSSGLLAALSHAPEGLTEEALQSETKLSSYAVRVLLDLLAPAGVVERVKSANAESAEDPLLWRATPVADLLLFDDMTRANFFFTKDVNYEALAKLGASLAEGRPAGLAAFDSSWKTIYPHLPELPEAARKAWFGFDHFHSDRAYEAALEVLGLARDFKHLVDIGGNTGRFTHRFLLRNPKARATVVDLPVQTEAIPTREELQEVVDRIDVFAIDWLTDAELHVSADADLFWMSQFLDCFSEDEAVSILVRTKAAMKATNGNPVLAVLEPVVDEQRHEAAELSLAATSLYFTAVANGNSAFFRGNMLRKIFKRAGFAIRSEVPNLGISHTLFLLEPTS